MNISDGNDDINNSFSLFLYLSLSLRMCCMFQIKTGMRETGKRQNGNAATLRDGKLFGLLWVYERIFNEIHL